jgi:DNA-binding LacI/PurR family transcriptional regulator
MMLKHKQIDGLIICSRICGWDLIEEFNSYGPIILCEDTRGKLVSSTYIDHYKVFFKALEYLHAKGHHKIGYCIGRNSGSNSQQRELAYKDFLTKNNKPYEQNYIFYDCYHFEDGDRVVQRLKNMKNPPSALLVTSDQVAAGILICCKEQNIAVPADLALIGFDNQPIAKIMNITTLEIPLIEVGKKLFLQALDNSKNSKDEVSVRLIERLTV